MKIVYWRCTLWRTFIAELLWTDWNDLFLPIRNADADRVPFDRKVFSSHTASMIKRSVLKHFWVIQALKLIGTGPDSTVKESCGSHWELLSLCVRTTRIGVLSVTINGKALVPSFRLEVIKLSLKLAQFTLGQNFLAGWSSEFKGTESSKGWLKPKWLRWRLALIDPTKWY